MAMHFISFILLATVAGVAASARSDESSVRGPLTPKASPRGPSPSMTAHDGHWPSPINWSAYQRALQTIEPSALGSETLDPTIAPSDIDTETPSVTPDDSPESTVAPASDCTPERSTGMMMSSKAKAKGIMSSKAKGKGGAGKSKGPSGKGGKGKGMRILRGTMSMSQSDCIEIEKTNGMRMRMIKDRMSRNWRRWKENEEAIVKYSGTGNDVEQIRHHHYYHHEHHVHGSADNST